MTPTQSRPPVAEPTLLFEDTHLIVLSKPAGLLSQGESTGSENLVDWLRAHVGRPYIGLVHRLDRNTSGIMVVAKRTKSAQRLTEALQKGELGREYLAWAEGSLKPLGKTLRWEHVLKKDEKTNIMRVVHSGSGAQKAALSVTGVQPGLWKGQPLTLLRFKLETGRSHQIRVQSAAEGFPLLGDSKYGARYAGYKRPALHSWLLEFPHPMGGEILRFEAELPEDMRSLLTQPLK